MKTTIRSHVTIKLAGPAQTYSSIEFGYDVEEDVEHEPGDEMSVVAAAQALDEQVDELCTARRDRAYRELLSHIAAIEAKSYREPK